MFRKMLSFRSDDNFKTSLKEKILGSHCKTVICSFLKTSAVFFGVDAKTVNCISGTASLSEVMRPRRAASSPLLLE